MTICLRTAQAEDEDFLLNVYASTRAGEMDLLRWSRAEKEAFLQMQSRAQRSYYAAVFPQAEYDLILIQEQPAGRIFINRSEDEIHLIDIALLPDYRGQGIGTALLHQLQDEGRAQDKFISLNVEAASPARQLYERLGFIPVSANGIFCQMEWRPSAPTGSCFIPAAHPSIQQPPKR